MGPIPTHNISRYGIQYFLSPDISPPSTRASFQYSVVPKEHEHTRNLFRLTGRLWHRQRRRRNRTGPTGDQSLQRRRRHRFLSFLDRLPRTLLPSSLPYFVPFLIPATTDDADNVVGDPSRLACRPILPPLVGQLPGNRSERPNGCQVCKPRDRKTKYRFLNTLWCNALFQPELL